MKGGEDTVATEEGRGGVEFSVGLSKLPVSNAEVLAHPGPGETPQGNDELGLKGPDLGLQVGRASRDLFFRRVSVVGGPALEDVGNENVLSTEADRRKKVVEELSSPPHEGSSLEVFILARGFSNDEDLLLEAPFSRNWVRSSLIQWTLRAGTYLFLDLLQGAPIYHIILSRRYSTSPSMGTLS